jgi:oligopeptide/dipeptide ABC transporter ATP-binding protein
MADTRPLLSVEALSVSFAVEGRRLHALDAVSLAVASGETVGLVGESGSGKSTLARAVMRAHRPDSGRVVFAGTDITRLSERALRPIRQRLQMIFQDPYASLDPRWTVRRILAEPLVCHARHDRDAIERRVRALIEAVGLPADTLGRLPSEFSGGQRQRIAIARALALEPDLIVADEPVSSLDVSIQAQVVNLLRDLKDRLGIAYLVIAHDLPLVHQMADRIVVMYLGRIVEEGPADAVVGGPLHPYTAALLSATPTLDAAGRKRVVLKGEPPSAIERPTGCHFHPRCPIARPRCAGESPPLVALEPGRAVRCFFPGEMPPPIALASASADSPT